MKDSGIEWIGEIPENWDISSIGTLFFAKAGGDAKPELYSDTQDEQHPFPVYTNTLEKEQVYAYTSNPVFEGNTITVTGRGDIGHAFYRDTPYDAIIRLISLSPRIELHCPFYKYWIDVVPFFADNAAIGQLSANQIKNYKAIIAPIKEQQSISAYLDRQCSHIDNIIEKTKASVEEYKKLRQAVITQAVTKGVRGDRPMKDSGSVWFGDIPVEWSAKRLKYQFHIKKDIAGKEGFTVLSITQKGIIPKDLSKNEGQLAESYANYQLVDVGDFAMNHMDLLTGWVDISKFDGVTSPDYRVFVLDDKDNSDSHYFLYMMQMCYTNKIFYGLGQGVSGLGRWRLQADKFLNFVIPIPPYEGQKEIADYLDKKCAEIDTLITKKEQFLAELESYKKSLIYEYVTGKKEVPQS
ncbi:type I restriction enzyme, S subunit [Ruminococcus sp. YRD2003]|uniref:restriction endonuclease subunit S n=1 Tax=Ruminococcus sp. YRD2003 TaxID=1452313 RepID=UPI0008B64345|nr:type I restriction enzyme, S subunit [Ruminococcus flavefaciens]